MARLFTIGWEIDAPLGGTLVFPDSPNGLGTSGTGTLTRATANQRSGAACLSCVVFSTTGYVPVFTPALSKTYFVRAYFRLTPLPTTTATILGAATATSVSARLTSGGKLQLWDNAGGVQIGSDSAATIAVNTYYRVELRIVLNASTQITDGELRLDGVTVATFTGRTFTGTPTINVGWGTNPGVTTTLLVDDVAVNDSTGSVNNTWPGDGKVVLLKPISDNAVGTGWTLSTGTAISANGWSSVDNTPPIGQSFLNAGSDPNQITNVAAAANSNYDANLTSYTTAGVGSTDTINAVVPWVCTGSSVVTSAKLGTVGVVSNPAITAVNLGAGGTAGAFWSGVAQGTYASGWKWSPGTVTEAPTVTKGTSPVARVTQVTSSTRNASVCFLGMYVDYSPPGAAPAASLVEAGSRGMRSRAIPHLMIR